jgi:hypothetical protein
LSTAPAVTPPNPAQAAYRAHLRDDNDVPHLIDRRFTLSKDGGGYAPDIARAYSSLLRAREPQITDLLELPNVIVLAEPGAGKSTVTRTAVLSLLSKLDLLPVRISLLECSSDRTVQHLVDAALNGIHVAADERLYYLVDGIDEVPRELLDRTSAEIAGFRDARQTAGMLATSRQAFYVANRDRLPTFHSVYHLLDFSNRDIERYVTSHGIEHSVFISETKRLAFFEEIRNPFNLANAVNMYRKSGRLPATRAELLDFIVRSQLQTRPEVSGFRQQRALEQLAVAMEVYARNELTEDEAVLVIRQSIHDISSDDARRLLDTLYTTILNKIEGGLSFQLASYGEYLAAQSLATEPLERVKEIAFDQGGVPNPSWSNAISYLAELNAEVRNYFCRWHPLWMMNVSPASLSPSQREEIVRSTLRRLASERMFAFAHPRVRIHRLAGMLTNATKADLLQAIGSDVEVEKGNAIVLLGIAGDASVIEQATELVLNRQNSQQLRYSGLLALQDTHAADTATRLLNSLDPGDPLHLNVLDVIGTVATLDELPQVLPALLRASGMPSSAYYRFQEMRSREAALAILRYAESHLTELNFMRADMYFGPAFEVVWEYFDEEVSRLCASILNQIERGRIYVDRSGPLPKLLSSLANLQDAQKEQLLRGFVLAVEDHVLLVGATFYPSGQALSNLLTRGAVEWLVASGRTPLIPAIVRWIDDDKAKLLAPFANGIVEAQAAARNRHRHEELSRQEEAKSRIQFLQDAVLSQTDLNGALGDFSSLTNEHWPPIAAEYRTWLEGAVSERLVALDLSHGIVWDGNTVTYPAELATVLELIGFYELHVTDPLPMVHTLILGWEEAIARYFHRTPPSDEAWAAVLSLLQAPPSPNALDHVVRFLGNMGSLPDAIHAAVLQIATANQDGAYTQVLAFALVAEAQSVPWLEERIAQAENAGVRHAAETELIRRQHEPTLMAKLDAAIRNPASLGGDHYVPEPDKPEWLSKTTAPFAWDKVRVLRERAFQKELHGVVSQCTDILIAINRSEAIAVFKRQLSRAPASWQIRQRTLILEQEELLAIDEARLSPFDRVLARLRHNTSSTRVKVWCEGINDEEVFRTLIERMSDVPIDVTIGNVHGWPGLQQEGDPNIWLANCKEAFIIMDGDNGRELRKAKKPLTDMARAEYAKVRGFPITLFVLERYGIENYLSQDAVEAVVGRDLSAFFPIPPDIPIHNHFTSAKKTIGWKVRNVAARIFRLAGPSLPSFYPKGKNKEVAKYLQPADLEGTDLYDALKKVLEAAKRLQGDSTLVI